ncbi:vesicle transport protein SEC20 [Exaiptasia diaphana]|uniref:Sec20 C-terminal domain-containing protein n=1 Tax=Exaiptasia diaphana TaxID=2652724 RepID=A0A913X0K8_EXADI|nr:vesicle transport protein SEC20 [Exaiptasia diaphana]
MADELEVSREVPIQAKIQVRDVVKVEFEIQNLVQEIRQCDGPLTLLNELNMKIKMRMNSLKMNMEKLEQLAKEQDKDSDTKAILLIKNQHDSELIRLQSSIRKANLACKARIDQTERESLFSGQASSLRNRNYNKENLAATTSNITKDLMSIARNSSATVTDTQEEYKGLSGVIQTSKNLLNKYNRREVTDRLLVVFGLILFAVTVLYIVKKRVW